MTLLLLGAGIRPLRKAVDSCKAVGVRATEICSSCIVVRSTITADLASRALLSRRKTASCDSKTHVIL